MEQINNYNYFVNVNLLKNFKVFVNKNALIFNNIQMRT